MDCAPVQFGDTTPSRSEMRRSSVLPPSPPGWCHHEKRGPYPLKVFTNQALSQQAPRPEGEKEVRYRAGVLGAESLRRAERAARGRGTRRVRVCGERQPARERETNQTRAWAVHRRHLSLLLIQSDIRSSSATLTAGETGSNQYIWCQPVLASITISLTPVTLQVSIGRGTTVPSCGVFAR